MRKYTKIKYNIKNKQIQTKNIQIVITKWITSIYFTLDFNFIDLMYYLILHSILNFP